MERTINILSKNPISLIFIGMIILGILLLLITIFQNKNKEQEQISSKEIEIEDNEKEMIFNLYKELEIAKMKFRFSILEEKLSKELYSEIEKELKELKENNYKIVATNIRLEDLRILSRTKKENKEILEIFLHVSQYDYVINKEKNIIRGTDEDRYQIEHKITLEKNLDVDKYQINKMERTGKWIKK